MIEYVAEYKYLGVVITEKEYNKTGLSKLFLNYVGHSNTVMWDQNLD